MCFRETHSEAVLVNKKLQFTPRPSPLCPPLSILVFIYMSVSQLNELIIGNNVITSMWHVNTALSANLCRTGYDAIKETRVNTSKDLYQIFYNRCIF